MGEPIEMAWHSGTDSSGLYEPCISPEESIRRRKGWQDSEFFDHLLLCSFCRHCCIVLRVMRNKLGLPVLQVSFFYLPEQVVPSSEDYW